ncbi:MAG: hypothetical protein ACREMQ_15400, partial [Longimicrobiales bacterium]
MIGEANKWGPFRVIWAMKPKSKLNGKDPMNVRPTNRRTTLAIVLASIAGIWGLANAQSAPAPVRAAPSDATAPNSARRIRLVTAPEGNEARYRVNEQLVGIDLPSDAVGTT